MNVNNKSKRIFYLLIFIILSYSLFFIYFNYSFYDDYYSYLKYENLSIIYKYCFKLIYLILTYLLLHLLSLNNLDIEYDEKLIDKLFYLFVFFSESGIYFNLFKTIIYNINLYIDGVK